MRNITSSIFVLVSLTLQALQEKENEYMGDTQIKIQILI